MGRVVQSAPDGYTLSVGNWTSHVGGGAVYPVNPKYKEILGIPCYPDVASIPGDIDIAVYFIPAQFLPETIRACAAKGIWLAT